MKLFFKKLVGIILFTAMASTVHADAPATHGMLLFGDKVTYASHLPMFHKPHDYQLIMKLSLVDASQSDALKIYELAKTKGETLFTIVPETMDLTLIMDGSKKTFSALLYQGHFERGGAKLGPIAINVDKIIFSKKLNPSEAEETLDYLIFGEQSEYFAAHIIKGKPSFDMILKVSQAQRVNSFCGRGFCPEPAPKAIKDASLPLVVREPIVGEKSAPAKIGDKVGSFSAFAKVLDIIYLEEPELSH